MAYHRFDAVRAGAGLMAAIQLAGQALTAVVSMLSCPVGFGCRAAIRPR